MNIGEYESQQVREAIEGEARRLGDAPGVQREGATAVLVAEADADYQSIEGALFSRGMDPTEWVIERAVTNDWDITAFGRGHDTPVKAQNHQLKLHLRHVDSFIRPARIDGPTFEPATYVKSGSTDLWAVFTDWQCPYQDDALMEQACEWLRENKPAYGLIGGDNTDLPILSKYARDPTNDTSVQLGIDTTYYWLRRFKLASPGTVWYVLGGNHDARMPAAVVAKLPELHGLTRAVAPEEAPGLPVLSIPFLLRLDELGMTWITNELGDYPHGHINLDPADFAWYHGFIVKPRGGASGLATAQKLGRSCGVGHTHSQAVTHWTQGTRGRRREYTAVESGLMGDPHKLAYGVAMDMQQGFATVEVWDNGDFQPDLARYRNGRLTWRGQRYE